MTPKRDEPVASLTFGDADDETLLRIGRIAYWWSAVEEMSVALVHQLLHPLPLDAKDSITAGVKTETLWKLSEQLMRAKGMTEEADRFFVGDTCWLQRAKKAQRERNDAIHGLWATTSPDGGLNAVLVTPKRLPKGKALRPYAGPQYIKRLPIKKTQLDKIWRDIRPLPFQLGKLVNRIGDGREGEGG